MSQSNWLPWSGCPGPLEPLMTTREMSRLMNSTAKLTPVQRAVLLHLQVRDEGDRAAAVVQQRQPDRPQTKEAQANQKGA